MSADERKTILEAYKNLRVTDVCDGMDWVGVFDVGLVSANIRPLWRTKTVGIAKTVRYKPTMRRVPTMTPEEHLDYRKSWEGKIFSSYPFGDLIEDGDMVMIDQGGLNVAVMGSNNSFALMNKGMRGVVIDGGCRDTDEVILEKIPMWSRYCAVPMPIDHLEFSDMMNTITVGGVQVNPGDVVVADGDGVVVVPRAKALEVAEHARYIHVEDNEIRRELYKKAGLPEDDSLL